MGLTLQVAAASVPTALLLLPGIQLLAQAAIQAHLHFSQSLVLDLLRLLRLSGVPQHSQMAYSFSYMGMRLGGHSWSGRLENRAPHVVW